MKFNSIVFGFLLFAFTTANIIAKAQAVNVKDSLALVDLYNSTNGARWLNHNNWLTKKPVNAWYGITVTGINVTSISLESNNLTGALPASISDLTALLNLDLYYNRLSNSIPASIGNLVKLFSIWIWDTINH